jgi:hypothetical protein
LPAGSLKIALRKDSSVNERYETQFLAFTPRETSWPGRLVHVASFEAIKLSRDFFPGHRPKKVTVFPGYLVVTAGRSVGLTERAAKEKGPKFCCRRSLLAARLGPGKRRLR